MIVQPSGVPHVQMTPIADDAISKCVDIGSSEERILVQLVDILHQTVRPEVRQLVILIDPAMISEYISLEDVTESDDRAGIVDRDWSCVHASEPRKFSHAPAPRIVYVRNPLVRIVICL